MGVIISLYVATLFIDPTQIKVETNVLQNPVITGVLQGIKCCYLIRFLF